MKNKIAKLLGMDLNEIGSRFIASPAYTRAIFKGNQAGGTFYCAYDAVLRILGLHPVERRNKLDKPIRFVSKSIPQGEDDVKNQQYVEFRQLLPPELIKRRLSFRNSTMAIRDPFGGSDKVVEFMGSHQDIDAFMSTQCSAYYQDEEIDRIKWDESVVRLLRYNGDAIICMAPVKGMDWTYDRIYRKASKIYRSKAIVNKYNLPAFEESGKNGAEVFCMATDDNPVMDPDTIDRIFNDIDEDSDPDTIAIRRYGVFKQVQGRVYKSFDKKIHVISRDKFFNQMQFKRYWHYRIIDFHPQKPWYVSFVAVTPQNEWFVWNEMIEPHDRLTDFELRDEIKKQSLLGEDDEFNRSTLIDPLSRVKQHNTLFSVYDDISTGEFGLRRCQTADTKTNQIKDCGSSGRMHIKTRLKNSVRCATPGNNKSDRIEGDPRFGNRLPTIWFMDNCQGHIEHFNSWRYQEFKHEHVRAVKSTKKETEKWSDFCKNIEFLGVENPVFYTPQMEMNEPGKAWFQGSRYA